MSIEVEAGEIHAIVGENGAGKSTLMKVLSGSTRTAATTATSSTRARWCDSATSVQSEAAGIAIIHQELALIPELSITENIFLGNELNRRGVINWREAKKQAAELLHRVGLRDDPDTQIKHIGVGKQQLVEIAKALHKSVKLLILDEPTAALNEATPQHLLDLIVGLKGKGVSSIIISHKLNEIEQIADRSRSCATARPSRPRRQGRRRGRGPHHPGHGRPQPAEPVPRPHAAHRRGLLRGEQLDRSAPPDPRPPCLQNESFFVRRGEIVGFAGLMGAGRTELAMSIFGRSYGT